MIIHRKLEPMFVRQVPDVLELGTIYVSMDYGTTAHSCCCGCGEKVWAPLTPDGWHLTYDGENVSLWPSIGNWSLPCESHYVIRKGEIVDAGPKFKKAATVAKDDSQPVAPTVVGVADRPARTGLWSKVLVWMTLRDNR